MDLDQIRKDIDQIDQELVALLERRQCSIKEGREKCLRKSALS